MSRKELVLQVSNKAVELLMKDMGLQVCCDG